MVAAGAEEVEGEEEGEAEDSSTTMDLQNTSLVFYEFPMCSLLLSTSEVGSFVHPCEEDLVCKGNIEKVPYFNAPIYLESKTQIGKVDEIFGPMNSYVIVQFS